MKTKSKLAMAASIFGIAALGLGTGAVAWFQVASAANAQLEGQIIGLDEGLQVGFMFDAQKTDLTSTGHEALGLTEDSTTVSGKYIYWSTSTQVMPKTISAVCNAGGATVSSDRVTLDTVTSGSRTATGALSLYEAPVFNNTTPLIAPISTTATADKYLHYDMVFRVKTNAGSGTAVSGRDIAFEIAPTFTASGDDSSDVTKSLRIAFTVGSNTTLYNTTGAVVTTTVGGRCDLDNDGYYDYKTFNTAGNITNQEVAYGEFNALSNTGAEGAEDVVGDTAVASDFHWGVKNVADSSLSGTASFLNAKSKLDVQPLVLSGDDGVEGKTAISNALPAVDTTIVTTDATGIATLGFTMFLEGWDPACGNQIASANFASVMSYCLKA